MHLTNKPKKTKGAALVEYVVLMALIGVVLISVVLTVGVNITDTFVRSTETIENPEGNPPGGNPPAVVPPPPAIPTFPTAPVPPSGNAYSAYADVQFFYETNTVVSYGDLVEGGFSSNITPGQFDFDNGVTWTEMSLTEGEPGYYNELVLGTTGMTHNIGPLPGWGASPASSANCQNNINLAYYQVVGYDNATGDRIDLYVTIRYADCPITNGGFALQVDRGIGHNQAFPYTAFGTLANALVAEQIAAGTYDPITGNTDWTEVDAWTLDYLDFPDVMLTGNSFNVFQINDDGYSLNAAGPGPAFTVCGESTQMGFTVSGTHPNSSTMQITVNISAATQYRPDTSAICFGDP